MFGAKKAAKNFVAQSAEMMRAAGHYVSKKTTAIAAGTLTVSALVASGAANAAVDASVSTAVAGVQTDATTLGTTVTPVVVGILAIVIGIKLVKRFMSKL